MDGAFAATGTQISPATVASAQSPTPPTPAPSPSPEFRTFNASDFIAEAAKLPSGLVEALARDLGESGEQYLAGAAAARQAVLVVDQLRQDGVGVLGSELSGTQLLVYVETSQDAAAVTAAGATPIIGEPEPFDGANRVFRTKAATNILGGSGYWYELGDYYYFCSVGFNGRDSTSGEARFVTAGHCLVGAESLGAGIRHLDVTTPQSTIQIPTTGAVIGAPVTPSVVFGGGGDRALVTETGAGITQTSEVFTWAGTQAVSGQSAAIAGASLCKSGLRTGWTCGTILAVDETVDVYDDDNVAHEVNSIIADTCVLSGDSGGAAVTGNFAIGITSASSFAANCSEPDNFSAFFPLVSAGTNQSVSNQLPGWELSVQLAKPVVTSVANGGVVGPDGSISGTLANTFSGVGVCLRIDTTVGAGICGTVGSNGSWSIPLGGSVAAGAHTYYVQATYRNYSRSTFASGSFTVPQPSTIAGTVQDKAGNPLSGFVNVYSAGGSGANAATFIKSVAFANGQYLVPNLLAGSYKLAYVTSNASPTAGDFSPASSEPFATQWHSGKYSYDTAGVLTVATAGQNLTGVNVVLEKPFFADQSNPSEPFYAYIEWMASSGLSTGTAQPGGKPLYKPADAVSRQAMSAFLFRLSGESFTPPAEATFVDVPTTHPFYAQIEWMAAKGISTGYAQPSGKPKYNPSTAVSRQAMSAFLFRMSGQTFTPPSAPTFADVPTDNPFYAQIEWMAAKGISTGTVQPSGKPLFKPGSSVSRQAMAAFLYRYHAMPS